MKKINLLITLTLFLCGQVQSQSDCEIATAQTDLHANQIKAKLLVGGDLWWDTDDAKYLVNYNGPNANNPSAIFAGGIWMGGFTPDGELKLAAKTYGSGQGQTDFFPGPLDPVTSTTDQNQCHEWDRFFEVTRSEIEEHLRLAGQSNYTVDKIPKGVKQWPAKGNPFFKDIFDFELPNTSQGLADFFDENEDGIYNPLDGDYPAIFQEGCEMPSIPEQMIFWIFNDAGNEHTETRGDAMNMEFQVTAFAYHQPNALDFSTFYKYKIINRNSEDLNDAYFGLWMDPDLGCYTDDYFGCDTTRDMAYLYNMDSLDGQFGTDCPDEVVTFGDNIPMVGIDFLRTPRDENDEEIGMTSFTYYIRPVGWPSAVHRPQTALEYYRFLSGIWRDGTPYTFGGSGYSRTGRETKFAFPSAPNCIDSTCWSLCSAGLGEGDRKTIQSVGPLQFKPNESIEVIIGVVTTFGAALPCPSLDKLGADDDFIQSVFDNCLQFQETPDAPKIEWEEGNQHLLGKIVNDDFSNNFQEKFEAIDIIAPDNLPANDRRYKFEGYKIFQIKNKYIGSSDLNNPEKARLVFQTDIQNGIEEIFNWKLENGVWVPESKVNAPDLDRGLELTFELEKDAFTGNDFENDRTYHFAALAYAHNNWQPFNNQISVGQRTPYLEGNLHTSSATPTIVPPSPDLGFVSPIVRIDGIGAGQRFLDMAEEMYDKILSPNFDGKISYQGEGAPFEVRILDPDKLKGAFELTFIDNDLNDSNLEGDVLWQLTNLDNPSEVFVSESRAVDYQEFPDYGFAIHSRWGLESGNNENQTGDIANGAIGSEIVYADSSASQWFSGIPDDFSKTGIVSVDRYNYILNESNEVDNLLDPDQKLSKLGSGFFTPYLLGDYRVLERPIPFITPVWAQVSDVSELVRRQISLSELNNVDLVFTSDKSKWSRCVIVETSAVHVKDTLLTAQEDRRQFDLRGAPSVGKDDANGDGLPDPDGDGEGMGWFPGYAIDVETGQRLNVFFGEASIYRCDEPFFQQLNGCDSSFFQDNHPTGADMMWNPTSQLRIENLPSDVSGLWEYITGGQHFIYLTKQPYDSCVEMREQFRADVNPLFKARAFGNITWMGFPVLAEGQSFNSYADGLIPNDMTVKLRVDNPFNVYEGTGIKNGYPTYLFGDLDTISNTQEIANQNPLDEIILSPNPIYSKTDQQLTISNLPTKSNVRIFDMNGKVVTNLGQSELTSVVWKPKGRLASGMYLVQIEHAVWGRKVLKWVCLN